LAFFPSKAQDLGIAAPSIHKIWGFSLFEVGEDETWKKNRNCRLTVASHPLGLTATASMRFNQRLRRVFQIALGITR
jgi:hypothetical protein